PGAITRMLDKLDHAYARGLGWALSHRFVTVATILALFVGSMFLRKKVGSEFFPETDEGQFSVIYKTPIGTRVEKTELVTERIEKVVNQTLAPMPFEGKEVPLYTTVLSDTGLPGGRTALFTANTGSHSANVGVNLVGRVHRPISDVQATEKVRAALSDALPGTQVYYFTGGIVKRLLNFGGAAPLHVQIPRHPLPAR